MTPTPLFQKRFFRPFVMATRSKLSSYIGKQPASALPKRKSTSRTCKHAASNDPYRGNDSMIQGVHTMFYSSRPEELRAFLRDKLGFTFTDVGDGWLIFDL